MQPTLCYLLKDKVRVKQLRMQRHWVHFSGISVTLHLLKTYLKSFRYERSTVNPLFWRVGTLRWLTFSRIFLKRVTLEPASFKPIVGRPLNLLLLKTIAERLLCEHELLQLSQEFFKLLTIEILGGRMNSWIIIACTEVRGIGCNGRYRRLHEVNSLKTIKIPVTSSLKILYWSLLYMCSKNYFSK